MADVIEDREALPLLPLRSHAPLPGSRMPVELGRPVTVDAVRRSSAFPPEDPRRKKMLVAVQRDAVVDRPGLDDVHPIGAIVELEEVLHGIPGRMTVLLSVGERVRITHAQALGTYHMATYEPVEENTGDPALLSALAAALRELVAKHDDILPKKSKTEARRARREAIVAQRDPSRVADLVAGHIELDDEVRVELLLELDVETRLRRVIELTSRATQTVEVQRDIDMAVREHLSRHEHEAVLRHKKRAIEAELGEGDGKSELEDLTERLSKLDLHPDVLGSVARELKRLSRMNPQSGEANVVRTWLECIADLPWGDDHLREERVDLDDARQRLDAGHHGLTKVKRRVIEYLCVRKLARNKRSPILCLAGPPGVGKTTLARSMAETLGREFFRISLGGVRDDSEIRGHRRTYVGAQPGRIIATMRRAESRNPLILLDEIDKLSEPDTRGDPAAALLETLDPEQNDAFEDHYVGGPFDLSQVIFVCTANDLSSIPGPLRDRLEIIHMSGYTVGEKIQIAREHLLARERSNHGLEDLEFEVPDAILESLATEYTRESGVRNLQRAVASLLRHVAMTLAEGKTPPAVATEALVLDALGPPRYLDEGMGDEPRVGVVTGLGWTPSGGRLLFIEATRVRGEGRLRLTGRLGDVMQESAKAALSLIRSAPEGFGAATAALQKSDLHVHLPAGAVPKDGPSAGVGLVTVLASSLSGRPVRNDVAMTGEITLRGQVLPVGGIREKVLAAHRAGIRTVLLPEQNRKDEPDIPQAALADLTIHYVRRIEEVLSIALLDLPAEAPAPAA